ncbi:olfactory receptor 11A1-like [Lates calcarifer]|uniref:Olfactory receptor n=2 Tax=Lates calcarifer TaxID=8187 RepID=A0AAJ7PXD4_LATCA|nr:olfactory receptor 11A1-like [Lates calcarifer]XP_018541125.1 olfactory receptor 11A1-like [Lates calcarifer]
MNQRRIMMNSTQVSYFTLTAYFDTGSLKYLFFIVVMSLYISIICSNVLLIMIICMNRSLHEPMYLFLCSMFVNQLYGSTAMFPFLLLQILSDIHTVSVPFCFLQIFCLYSSAIVELVNLAVMSYDRYLSICYPLQYNTRMTFKKVAILIAVTWFHAFLVVIGTTYLSSSLQLCGNIIDYVYCVNYSVVKLACSDTTVNNIYGLFATSFSVFVPLILILYTYIKILKVCFSASKQTRQKAVSTCTPHLASLINFSFGCLFDTLHTRFDMSSIPSVLRIFLSMYLVIIQPLLNPIMYGLQMSKIRNTCKKLLCYTKLTTHTSSM